MSEEEPAVPKCVSWEEGELWRLTAILLHWESQKRKTYKQTSEETMDEQPGISDLRARMEQLADEVGEKQATLIRRECMKYYLATALVRASMAKNKASMHTAPTLSVDPGEATSTDPG